MVKDLTKGNVRPVLWSFTIPMFISVVFQQLYNMRTARSPAGLREKMRWRLSGRRIRSQ